MLRVYTMLWGDKYPQEYVLTLERQVARWLQMRHEFICITHQHLPVRTQKPPCDFPGWWGKVGLFRPGFAPEGQPCLWLDLDLVLVGSLDPIGLMATQLDGQLLGLQNWAQSGHGGIQSSILGWIGGQCQQIWHEFDPAWAHWPPRNEPGILWGDQEWMTRLRDEGRLSVTHPPDSMTASYKYHCQSGSPPANARAIVFHGKPDPHEVEDAWVQEARL